MIDLQESQTIQRLELWKSSLILVEVLRAAGVDEEQFVGFLTFFEPEDHGILSVPILWALTTAFIGKAIS